MTDYNKSEAELVHVMDTLERGVSIIQREMSKNPAFLQDIVTRNMNNVVTALTAVVDAAYEVKIDDLHGTRVCHITQSPHSRAWVEDFRSRTVSGLNY